MPYIERPNEPTLYYDLDDYTDPWKKAPVILLQHGFSRSSCFWYSWVPYLSRFYKVVRPDLRGLGRSSADFDFDKELGLEIYFSDLNAIIDHVGADSVHYCGESFGGILGMAFAGTHRERVRTLSLVSAPVYISDYDKESTTYGYGSRIEALQKMGARAWAEASNAGRRFPADADPGLLKWYCDEMGKGNVDLLVAMFRWVSGFTAEPYLPRITAPVLGLYPASGPVTDDEQLRLLKEKVRDLRLVTIPSRFHAIQNFEPAACATHVLHFAAQRDGIACHE